MSILMGEGEGDDHNPALIIHTRLKRSGFARWGIGLLGAARPLTIHTRLCVLGCRGKSPFPK